MKLIIAGSRNITDIDIVLKALITLVPLNRVKEVVSGTARGVDKLGERWAQTMKVPIKKFPANWDKFGKSAGYRRNEEMAQYADALLAIWDGESKGTKHMIDLANKYGLKIYVH